MISNNSSVHQGFDQLLNAGRSLIVVQTVEEDRLEKILTAIGSARGQALWIWQANHGLTSPSGRIEGSQAAEDALAHLLREQGAPPIVWMKDLHHHYRPEVVRSLRDLYYAWRHRDGAIVVSATERAVPLELEREAAFLRMSLPDPEEIEAEVDAWSQQQAYDLQLSPQVVSATLRGLTRSEILHGLARIRADNVAGQAALTALQEEKRQIGRAHV